MSIEARLAELGVTLPAAPAPAANYVPFVVSGNLVHISGQISQNAAGLIKGKLGVDGTVEQGAEAAKCCAISLLAQLKAACGGDFTRVVRAVKLTGFVNSAPDFSVPGQGDQRRLRLHGRGTGRGRSPRPLGRLPRACRWRR